MLSGSGQMGTDESEERQEEVVFKRKKSERHGTHCTVRKERDNKKRHDKQEEENKDMRGNTNDEGSKAQDKR